jgi:hypothetical protein
MAVRIFEVIFDKFNVNKICFYGYFQEENKYYYYY